MERINQITRSCFNAINAIQIAPERIDRDPDRFYRDLRARLERLGERAKRAGFDDADVDAIRYALVALADEVARRSVALSAAWEGRALQELFFDEHAAGEGFFDRLEQLERAGSTTYQREVLAVYRLCLLFGFRGRFKHDDDQAELEKIKARVEASVAQLGAGGELSPHAARPSEVRPEHRAGVLPLALGGGALMFAAVLTIILWGAIDRAGSQLANVIQVAGGEETTREEDG